jgi:sucrose-phosphate synthase
MPDVLITSVGSEIYYGHDSIVEDIGWRRTIDRHWDPDKLRALFSDVSGLRLQPKADQRPFKLSYFVDPDAAPSMQDLKRLVKEHGLRASLIYSHDEFLDLLPERASKGRALRYVAHRWGFPLDQVMVAGDSGNDMDMLRTGVSGVVVGNHHPELRPLRRRDEVYFSEAGYARGVLEGAHHHGFWPEPAEM